MTMETGPGFHATSDVPVTGASVIHYGLGPIGRAIAQVSAGRRNLLSVGAVDSDPRIIGRDLATLCELPAGSAEVVVGGLIADEPNSGLTVVLHSTDSSLAAIAPQIRECIERGYDVISTCEELSFPWDRSDSIALELDQLARSHGVRILGTGINPGFAMDHLPIILSKVASEVSSVAVSRRQDAGVRRIPLQRKVGAGLTVDDFAARAANGTIGHVGLAESAGSLARAFGWNIERHEESIEPLVASHDLVTDIGVIHAGEATGLHQSLMAFDGSDLVISLNLEMAIQLDRPSDEIWLTGIPDIHAIIPGGLHGDIGTAAIVVNSIEGLLACPPGLRTMQDLPTASPLAGSRT